MLSARTLREGTKKRRFFEIVFSKEPPASFSEAARRAGVPHRSSARLANRWWKEYADLPDPLKAVFIFELLAQEQPYLKERLAALAYDSSCRTEALKLLQILENPSAAVEEPPKPENPYRIRVGRVPDDE